MPEPNGEDRSHTSITERQRMPAPPPRKTWGKQVGAVAAVVAVVTAMTGLGWSARGYLGDKADEDDLSALEKDVAEIKSDVRLILRELEIEQ